MSNTRDAKLSMGSCTCSGVDALGGWFLMEAHRLHARVRADGAGKPFPMRLFHLSIAYLTLLFVAVAVSALLPFGRW